MNIKKIRFLVEKNVVGIPYVIYIKGTELQPLINKYENICSNIGIEGKLVKEDENGIYLSYEIEGVNEFILDKIINEEYHIEDIKNKARNLLNKEWSYNLIKRLRGSGVPVVKLKDNTILIGYGTNSKIISKEDYIKIGEDNIISSIKNKGLIPIIAVTGTNGKTTTTRLIHRILLKLGYKSGASTTGGIYIGEKIIKYGDTTGYYSALEVLKNKNVNIAVLETARGGIIKKGLGFKSAKACIITTLSEDHMGMEGVNSLKELGKIKCLVKEGLDKEDGIMITRADSNITSIFNKEDRLILFDNNINEIIKKHIENKGKAFYEREGYIIYNNGIEEIELLRVEELEFAHNGASKSNIRNVMAAICAVWSIHNNISEIINVVKEIKCDLKINKGRQNLIKIKDFNLLIDYGHNMEAYKEVFEIAKSFKPSKIIGLITAPGDREDNHIISLGKIAASYCDKIIIKEHEDKRGRSPGETANLLYEGIIQGDFNKENIKICLKEEDAIIEGLNEASSNDIVVSFSQFLNQTIPAINEYLKENGLYTI